MTQTAGAAAPHAGVFVSIEGGDGAGKSTQVALLAAYLESQGLAVRRVHEPGGTRLGERIRALLLDPATGDMDAVAELLLYEAARAQMVSEVIVPALRAGEVVVADRFGDSTIAYQGAGRQLGAPLVEKLNDIVCRGTVPDRTVLLSFDADAGLARAVALDGADRMERAGSAFHQRVHEGFAQVARAHSERVRVVDAAGAPEQVQRSVFAALADLFPGIAAPGEVSSRG